jgi:hypothetical protein
MDIMDNYNDALKTLYDHVGFVEGWVVYAVDDRTDMFWNINETEESVRYAETKEALDFDDEFCENEIYKQRFYDKWIYRGEKLTMIIVEGNRSFVFYDNDKEVK